MCRLLLGIAVAAAITLPACDSHRITADVGVPLTSRVESHDPQLATRKLDWIRALPWFRALPETTAAN